MSLGLLLMLLWLYSVLQIMSVLCTDVGVSLQETDIVSLMYELVLKVLKQQRSSLSIKFYAQLKDLFGS